MQGDSELRRAAAASEAALAPYGILEAAPEAAYDDIAQLASDLCSAPVALIPLFARDRQWFKGRIGFDGPEPPLEDSLCRHALAVDDLLVIPDLTQDSRTRDDAVVAGGPQARFYAGAPLRTPDGTFLGTICVLDFTPRPDGLTDGQASGLRALARQVMTTLELRRLVRERDAAIAAEIVENRRLASSEAHWRGLFEGLREGFAIAEVIRDDGKVIDWCHLEVNQAFLDVAGFTMEEVIGRTLRDIAPDVPDTWIEFTARVVDTGEPATFTQVGARNGRRYDGRTFPIGGDQFAIIFLDVTDRTAAERRQAALIAITDQLRDLERIEDMAAAAARIVGETIRVTRVAFGRLDPSQGTVSVTHDWTAPGVPSVVGVYRFADYGHLVLDGLLAGEPLIIDDVRTDPRTAHDPEPLLGLRISAQAQMPLRERGRTVAVLIVHDAEPRRWSTEELAFLRNVADRLEIEVVRVEAEQRRIVQKEELSHRLKNTLAMVQAIASQTLKPVNERALVDKFERRLGALATAHDVLLGSDWKAAPLGHVIQSVLDTAGQDEQVTLDGPLVELSPRATLSASLLIHELATNALKYGALSVVGGTVSVSWTVQHSDGRPTLVVDWTESGGPEVIEPTRRGFGSRLINMGLAGTGGVELSYLPTGVVVTMSAPLDDVAT